VNHPPRPHRADHVEGGSWGEGSPFSHALHRRLRAASSVAGIFWAPVRAALERESSIMITSERPSDRNGAQGLVGSDRRLVFRRPKRSMLIAVLSGAAALSPLAAPVALAAPSTGNVIAAVPVDWRQAWHEKNNGATPNSPGSGYGPGDTAVSSPATAAQSKGVVMARCTTPTAKSPALTPPHLAVL
jgi:hypothetical protein